MLLWSIQLDDQMVHRAGKGAGISGPVAGLRAGGGNLARTAGYSSFGPWARDRLLGKRFPHCWGKKQGHSNLVKVFQAFGRFWPLLSLEPGKGPLFSLASAGDLIPCLPRGRLIWGWSFFGAPFRRGGSWGPGKGPPFGFPLVCAGIWPQGAFLAPLGGHFVGKHGRDFVPWDPFLPPGPGKFRGEFFLLPRGLFGGGPSFLGGFPPGVAPDS